MWASAAWRRICRKIFSPLDTELGRGRGSKAASVVEVKEGQSAFLKLVKQRGPDLGGGLENQPLRPMIIGR